MAFTDTTQYTLLVETAYDTEVDVALRSQPMFRSEIVTKRPTNLDKPGDVVTFTITNDFAVDTTPLSETVDPTPTAAPAPTRVQVTLDEFGKTAVDTIRLQKLAFANVDQDLADKIAYNMVNTVDVLVRNEMDNCTNILYSTGASGVSTSGAASGITKADVFNSAAVRYAVAKLRKSNVVPVRGTLYPFYVDPDVSADLQAEAGSGGWRNPHEYSAPGPIWSGEAGTYLGGFFIETPRCTQSASGSGGVTVYNTYVAGRQALAEASSIDPHVVVGPVTDSLKRFHTIGWHTLIGWKLYRPEAMWIVKTGSSLS